jgi:hypothetical protein
MTAIQPKAEIVTINNQPEPASEARAILAVIERVATNPDTDIAKLEKMLDMQERILDRNAKQAFTASLAAMQMALPRVVENGKGHNNAKYALLEDINDQIRPTLHKFGFAITFRVKHDGPVILITTVLSHQEGHSEETTISLPADTTGSKNAVQAIGSTISYGKRYGIGAILNISTGDDTDGNVPQQESEPDITDWLTAIKDCASMDELQKVFAEAYRENKKHKNNARLLTLAKDGKKREITNG